MQNTIEKNTTIKAGNFIVSIGTEKHFVAIISPHTLEFVNQIRTKTNKRLRKVKRKLGLWLNAKDTFTYERISESDTLELINILKSK